MALPVTARPLRVGLAPDHPLVRAGLAAMLDTRSDLAVLSGRVAPFLDDEVDVVLFDVAHRGELPASVTGLRAGGAPRLVLWTWAQDRAMVGAAREAGVAALVHKGASVDELVSVLRAVCSGQPPAAHSAPTPEELRLTRAGGLTRREAEVLALLAHGLSNEEAARHLFISINTVKTALRGAYTKIGVVRRSQAVSWAVQRGVGPLPATSRFPQTP